MLERLERLGNVEVADPRNTGAADGSDLTRPERRRQNGVGVTQQFDKGSRVMRVEEGVAAARSREFGAGRARELGRADRCAIERAVEPLMRTYQEARPLHAWQATGPVARILHLLPHRGGGAETVIDHLTGIEGTAHTRLALSPSREPMRSVPALALAWPRIARALPEHDIVHAHGDVATAIAAPLLGRRPSVWSSHGLHFARRATGSAARIHAAALRRAGRVALTTAQSQVEREELLALGLPEPIELLLNGVKVPTPDPAARIAVRAELELDDGPVALFAAELSPHKGPLEAVAAAERAGVTLLVVGDGPMRDQLRSGGRTRVLGFRHDLPRLLQAVDIFLMPSQREGQSMAVLEAMAAGRALIVSDGPGNPETVGGTAIITPYGDIEALAVALRRLADDPAERERLGSAARSRVDADLSLERFQERWAAVYTRLLER